MSELEEKSQSAYFLKLWIFLLKIPGNLTLSSKFNDFGKTQICGNSLRSRQNWPALVNCTSLAINLLRVFFPTNWEKNFWLSYLSDTNYHVGDVGADGPDSSQLFAETEPLLNFEGLLVNLRDVDLQVAEALHQLAPWALNGHGASLHAALDPVRDGDVLTDVDSLHPENVEGCKSTVTGLQEPEGPSISTAHALSGLVDLSLGFTDSG